MAMPTVIIEGEYYSPKTGRYEFGTAEKVCNSIEEAERIADRRIDCEEIYKKWFKTDDIMISSMRAGYTEPRVCFYTASMDDILDEFEKIKRGY